MRIQEIATAYLNQMKLDGKRIVDIKDKKNLPKKIACDLQDLKIDGWTHMKYYHLNRHEYPMYKSLCDFVHNQLKRKLTPQKSMKDEETPLSPFSAFDDSEDKNGEQLANFENSEEPSAMIKNIFTFKKISKKDLLKFSMDRRPKLKKLFYLQKN